MPFLLSIATAVFAIKGLGGSFHALFTQLGIVLIHGPIIGALIGLLLISCYWFYATRAVSMPRPSKASVSQKARLIVVALFLVIVGAAVSTRISRMGKNQINVRQADMLPLISAGVKDAAHGHSPYHPRRLEEGFDYAGFFLPGVWLPFLPAELLGIDIRWTTIAVQVIFYLCLLSAFLSRKRHPFSFAISSGIFLALIALHAFSKLLVGQVVAVHTAGFSLFLTLFLWSVWKNRPWMPALVLPLMVLSREIAILFAIPYGAYLFRTEPKRFLKYFGIICVIGFGISLPFIYVAGSDFFAAFKFYAATTIGTPWQGMMQFYGLCGPLKKYGLVFLQPVLQLSGLFVALAWIFLGRCQSRMQSLALGGVVFIPFILFVSVTWAYMFIEPLILLYFLIAADDR